MGPCAREAEAGERRVTLHLSKFGGGIILAGSPDAQQTSEVVRCDAYDIGLREQLVASSAPSDYALIKDVTNTTAWDQLYALSRGIIAQQSRVIAVGNKGQQYQVAYVAREGSATPVPAGNIIALAAPHMLANPGLLVTMVQMPGGGGLERIFINGGAREGFYPNTAPGLYVLVFDLFPAALPITSFQSLANVTPNTKQLYFRGIAAYNDYVFGWGYDSADTVNFDGPCRMMFCNPGDGGRWGNDNQGSPTNPARLFTDSDAIVFGGSGEIIRAGIEWDSRFFIGTNQQLHFIEGYGRNTFLTDGSNPVGRSFNVVGPHALKEGPDLHLYGIAEKSGLWVMDSARKPDPVGRKLIDFDGRSRGYWDCIWTDPTQLTDYPGKTNRDLVWMVTDYAREQVIIGIPFCDAAAGYGYGLDTVVLKYHTRSGGFTRQVFSGVQYTAADWQKPENQQREARFFGTATATKVTLQRYAYQATQATDPAMPSPLPDVEFGPFAVYGADGVGAVKRLYLTLAWAATGSLPIVFAVTVKGGTRTIDTFTLTIAATAPIAPVAGDVWLDTSETDTNIGNATNGTLVTARRGYLTKRYVRGAWEIIPIDCGEGPRATIPLPIARTRAARVSFRFQCTAASGRFQLEGIGAEPGGGTHGA